MQLIDERREVTYRIVLGVAAVIVVWAFLHDQYLVQIAPEHFTEYHEPLGNIENPILIAALYAVGASIGPGVLLGIATAFIGRNGPRKRISPRSLVLGSVAIVIASEIAAASSGLLVYQKKDVFFPEEWFPDSTLPIQISQTIQITAYLAISFFSAVFLIGVHVYRSVQQEDPLTP